MDNAARVSQVEREGLLLGEAARRTQLDAAIGHCPEWTARDLVSHVGTVHRWAAAIVGTPREDPAVEPPVIPGDDELIEWYDAGHAALVNTLRAAPDDLECWFFLAAPSAKSFWARRQALETAVHRTDLELASGAAHPIDRDLAVDGMTEFLLGFGARKKVFEPGTIRILPRDAEAWHVMIGPEGLAATQDDPGTPPDVTVSGTASDVYRWMWNRPADVIIEGDVAVANEWQKIRVRWS